MKNLFILFALLIFTSTALQAQMPFQVKLVVNDPANTLTVKMRNVENNQPTTSQNITSINMRLLGSVTDIISIASTNYTMQMPSTTGPNTQVITMTSTSLQSPENWIMNTWVNVAVYNLTPGTYTSASFSVQPDLDGDNSDVQDPIMSVAASGVFNIPLTIQSTILPLDLLSFNVSKQNDNEVLLKWESENEVSFDRFEIEKSRDIYNFQKIGFVEGKGFGTYEFIDNNPQTGENYYRLKMVDLDGNYKFSEIRKVNFKNEMKLILYPNPSSTGEVSFSLQGIEKENDLNLSVTNSAGELVKSIYLDNIKNNTEYMTMTIEIPGIYFLRFSLSNGHTFVEKLVIRK